MWSVLLFVDSLVHFCDRMIDFFYGLQHIICFKHIYRTNYKLAEPDLFVRTSYEWLLLHEQVSTVLTIMSSMLFNGCIFHNDNFLGL